MLVGGAKCGSTSFARYLPAHPQVKILGPKEPNYWSWHRWPAKYQNFFVNDSPVLDPGPGHYISGEFSTSSSSPRTATCPAESAGTEDFRPFEKSC